MKNRKELLKSPVRNWNDSDKEYDAILLVPAGTKHESGYMHIAVIGVMGTGENKTYEIAAFPDDISTFFNPTVIGDHKFAQVRMDCYYPSGILQYHGRGKFKVSAAVSSIDITFSSKE